MKSICYVVLPDHILLDAAAVYSFVSDQIHKYNSDLEVEPYKRFFSREETLEIARRKGFSDLVHFEEHLKKDNHDEGIENGLYYWITTFNELGRWETFTLDDIKRGYDLINEVLPLSVVTPDRMWHSSLDYQYKPILDFKYGNQHPDNIEPAKKWRECLDSFFRKYRDKNMAVLYIKS